MLTNSVGPLAQSQGWPLAHLGWIGAGLLSRPYWQLAARSILCGAHYLIGAPNWDVLHSLAATAFELEDVSRMG